MFTLSAIHFLASQPEILLDCIVFVCLFVFFSLKAQSYPLLKEKLEVGFDLSDVCIVIIVMVLPVRYWILCLD